MVTLVIYRPFDIFVVVDFTIMSIFMIIVHFK
jgi:hypothetical protein